MLKVRAQNCAIIFRKCKKIPLLTAQEELALATRVQSGDSLAREKMVQANLFLVVYIARRFIRTGVCIQDIIAEGNLGLVHAVDMYQPDRATCFATYAKWWIRHSIQQFIAATAQPMRLPHYMLRRMAQMNEQSRVFRDSTGRTPTHDELAAHGNSSDAALATVQHASQSFRIAITDCSSNATRRSVDETIPDRRMPAPSHELERRETLTKLSILLDRLEDREATVLRLRHGFGHAAPLAVQDIALILGVTRQSVRRIEMRAMRKLKVLLHASGESSESDSGQLTETVQEALSAYA